jgi:D-tyrosyl-tRNA(Tyr) deacylase
MRVVIQRVSHASVTIEGVCKSAIKEGFMILVGIEEADTQEDADWLCKKIIGLRVFDDENGVMNKSILEVGGNILVISQFTLHASTKKGNRPCCKARCSHPPLQLFLPRTEHRSGQRSRNRRIRSRHES